MNRLLSLSILISALVFSLKVSAECGEESLTPVYRHDKRGIDGELIQAATQGVSNTENVQLAIEVNSSGPALIVPRFGQHGDYASDSRDGRSWYAGAYYEISSGASWMNLSNLNTSKTLNRQLLIGATAGQTTLFRGGNSVVASAPGTNYEVTASATTVHGPAATLSSSATVEYTVALGGCYWNGVSYTISINPNRTDPVLGDCSVGNPCYLKQGPSPASNFTTMAQAEAFSCENINPGGTGVTSVTNEGSLALGYNHDNDYYYTNCYRLQSTSSVNGTPEVYSRWIRFHISPIVGSEHACSYSFEDTALRRDRPKCPKGTSVTENSEKR
jgi:hypothetical protein